MENNNEHFQALAKTKREADQYLPVTPVLERAKLIWGTLVAMFAAIILGTFSFTMWLSGVNSKFDAATKERDALSVRITANEATGRAFDARTRADDQTHLAQSLLMQNMQKEMDNRAPLIKEHTEMWFMKEHGISNKEDFMSKHGYAAPNAQEEPTPNRK